MRNLLPIWGWRLVTWRQSISHCNISPYMGGRGGDVQALWVLCAKLWLWWLHMPWSTFCLQNEIKLLTQLLKTEAHLQGMSVPFWCKPLWCLPPVWRWHLMKYHHLWSIPEHTFGKEFYFFTWNVIASCQSSHSGCGGHYRGKEGIHCILRAICWLSQ